MRARDPAEDGKPEAESVARGSRLGAPEEGIEDALLVPGRYARARVLDHHGSPARLPVHAHQAVPYGPRER